MTLLGPEHQHGILATAIACLALWVGCAPAEPAAEPAADNTATHAANRSRESVPATTGANEVAVQIADRAAFDTLLERHRNQVILVDFWASWCIPCVQQFPHTVSLHKKYADRGLAVISVSLDDVENLEGVRKFLIKQEATFTNLLASEGSSEATFAAFDVGGVPAYRIYDRSGNLRREFTVDPAAKTQYTMADIEQLIEELL